MILTKKFSFQFSLVVNSTIILWLPGKKSSCHCRRFKFDPWIRKIPWKRKCPPIPVFLSGKFHGQRNLAGYSSWDYKESETSEQLSPYTHLESWKCWLSFWQCIRSMTLFSHNVNFRKFKDKKWKKQNYEICWRIHSVIVNNIR